MQAQSIERLEVTIRTANSLPADWQMWSKILEEFESAWAVPVSSRSESWSTAVVSSNEAGCGRFVRG